MILNSRINPDIITGFYNDISQALNIKYKIMHRKVDNFFEFLIFCTKLNLQMYEKEGLDSFDFRVFFERSNKKKKHEGLWFYEWEEQTYLGGYNSPPEYETVTSSQGFIHVETAIADLITKIVKQTIECKLELISQTLD